MAIRATPAAYLATLSAELDVQASRLRDLIGSRHWGCDGGHKEALLTSFVRRHLPAGLDAARGFVVNPLDFNECSREQDILVFCRDVQAPLFDNDSCVVIFPDDLCAAISVKTTLSKKTIDESLRGLRSLPSRDLAQPKRRPWLGAYFFHDGELELKHVHDLIHSSEHALRSQDGAEFGLRANPSIYARTILGEAGTTTRVFGMGGTTSTAVFLANLLGHCADARDGRRPDIDHLVDHLDDAEATWP